MRLFSYAFFALAVSACGGVSGTKQDASFSADLGSSTLDPFAAQPDESEGLTNVSTDLDAILEHGALTGACDRYRAGFTDRKTTLLCGKWMFFYETFGTFGVPAAILNFLAQNFPDELGLGFEKLGMIPDPTSTKSLPFGFAPTTPINGNIDSIAFTCASCHFAELPDGRYAVGAPNHAYDYRRHILTISLAPALGLGLGNASTHDPAAVAAAQPVLDKLAANAALRTQFELALLPLLAVKQPPMTMEIEHEYATWPKGTMDFVIVPLPIDDGVQTVSKMLALWGIPRADEATAAGMTSGLLATTGDAHGLGDFVQGFAALGGVGTGITASETLPLLEFIYSLRAPANPSPPDPSAVSAGQALFTAKHCTDCHDGPRGSGKRVYTFGEIGTDPAIAKWADPDLSGMACCGLPIAAGTLTHGVKSPRLVGMWTLGRFLHNGALASLDELFCRGAGRPAVGVAPLRTDGHSFTCDGLTDEEKNALIAYLLAH